MRPIRRDFEISRQEAAVDKNIRANVVMMQNTHITQFIKIHGIVVSASGMRVRPTTITLECTGCGHQKKDLKLKPGFEGIQMPRTCDS